MKAGVVHGIGGPLARRIVWAVDATSSVRRTVVDKWKWRGDGHRALSDVAGLLRPGSWRTVNQIKKTTGAKQALVSMHSNVQLPSPLRESAFVASGEMSEEGLPSTYFTVHDDECATAGHRGLEGFAADVWLRRWGAKNILVDLERAQALRMMPRPMSPDYAPLRGSFSRHVPTVDFHLVGDGRLILEEFFPGEMVSALSTVDGAAVIDHAQSRLRSLVEHESVAAPDPDLLRSAIERSAIAEVRHYARDILRLLEGAPHVACPGDLRLAHVIVAATGEYRVIDLDSIAMQPFWYGPWRLASEGPELWQRAVVAEQFDALFTTVEFAPISRVENWRRLLSLAGFAWVMHRRQARFRGPIASIRADAVRSTQQSRWDRWQSTRW